MLANITGTKKMTVKERHIRTTQNCIQAKSGMYNS